VFKKILKISACLLIVGYLLVAGVLYDFGAAPMRYREVQIHLCDTAESSFLRVSDVRAMITQAGLSPIGKTVEEYDTYKLSQRLEQNKLVRRADCYHTPDSILRVDIYLRHPILRVRTAQGGDYFVDTERAVMPVQNNAPAIHLPLATGYVTTEMAQGALYDFARYLQEHHFWRSAIVQINVTHSGEVQLIPRVGRYTILLGSLDDFEQKLDNLMAFYRQVPQHKGWNAYSEINLKFKGQVIATRNTTR
jgi:cell division protein FtsQ